MSEPAIDVGCEAGIVPDSDGAFAEVGVVDDFECGVCVSLVPDPVLRPDGGQCFKGWVRDEVFRELQGLEGCFSFAWLQGVCKDVGGCLCSHFDLDIVDEYAVGFVVDVDSEHEWEVFLGGGECVRDASPCVWCCFVDDASVLPGFSAAEPDMAVVFGLDVERDGVWLVGAESGGELCEGAENMGLLCGWVGDFQARGAGARVLCVEFAGCLCASWLEMPGHGYVGIVVIDFKGRIEDEVLRRGGQGKDEERDQDFFHVCSFVTLSCYVWVVSRLALC